MKRSPLFWPSAVLLLGIVGYTGAAVIPAIIPQAVPTANKRGAAGTVFALASNNTAGTAGQVACDDGTGLLTYSGCATNAVASTTPVTVNTNTTGDQNLMELSLSAGFLNSLGKPFDVFGAGVYTTQTGQTPTLDFKVKLCTVSGCGSGTVVTLASITSGATTGASSNISWNLRLVAVTAATGATGNLEVHGPARIDLGAALSTAATVYNDTNTAVSSNIDLTAALFVDFTVAFSTNAAGANTCTQREGVVNPGGSTAGGGGGTTVTVAAPYITVASTKYVAQTMFPFTAFPALTALDGNTCTNTAGTNGSELMSCALNAANAWYSIAATTSVEAEFSAGSATSITAANVVVGGIWICDTTNSKLYTIDAVSSGVNAQLNTVALQTSSWTLAGCAGTPSAVVGRVGPIAIPLISLIHAKLVKSGGNLLFQLSMDGGQTFAQLDSVAVGTLAKGGYQVRTTGNFTGLLTALSTSVN